MFRIKIMSDERLRTAIIIHKLLFYLFFLAATGMFMIAYFTEYTVFWITFFIFFIISFWSDILENQLRILYELRGHKDE